MAIFYKNIDFLKPQFDATNQFCKVKEFQDLENSFLCFFKDLNQNIAFFAVTFLLETVRH